MSPGKILEQLVTMSRNLGDPARDYAILGEGNTSARIDADTFWVKASGTEIRTIEANGFVQVRFDRVLAMLEADNLSDADVKAGLEAAKADPTATARPSVETVLHALALQVEGINFVGHTHPTAVNALLCSQKAEEAIAGRLFPDEIVYCGPAPVYVPYLGKTAQEVENVTAMAVKAARVLQGAYVFGGPHFLSPQNVRRIHTRPDELYRRQEWGSS
jgi:rhamnose utilization protein RhaD (predicted bifunctional aldolase and dehydrogenase)